MTLETVADFLGCTKAQISKLERGHVRLNDEWLDRLSGVFCCSVHDLIDDDIPVLEARESENELEKREFASAKMLGYIESQQAGFVEYISPDKQYPIYFAPPRALAHLPASSLHYVALTVKGGAFPAFPDGSQLIFSSVDEESSALLLKDQAVVLCALRNDNGDGGSDAIRVIEFDDLGIPRAVFKLRKSRQALVTLANDMLLGDVPTSKRLSIVAEAEGNRLYKKPSHRKVPLKNAELDISAVLVKAIVDRI